LSFPLPEIVCNLLSPLFWESFSSPPTSPIRGGRIFSRPKHRQMDVFSFPSRYIGAPRADRPSRERSGCFRFFSAAPTNTRRILVPVRVKHNLYLGDLHPSDVFQVIEASIRSPSTESLGFSPVVRSFRLHSLMFRLFFSIAGCFFLSLLLRFSFPLGAA